MSVIEKNGSGQPGDTWRKHKLLQLMLTLSAKYLSGVYIVRVWQDIKKKLFIISISHDYRGKESNIKSINISGYTIL